MANSEHSYQVMQISNDAYHNLAFGEECLDELNQEEADEIKSMFPQGFKIDCEKTVPVDGTDMVEITICVFSTKPQQTKYTHIIHDVNGPYKFEYYFIDKLSNSIHLRVSNENTGEVKYEYDTFILYKYGHYWIELSNRNLLASGLG